MVKAIRFSYPLLILAFSSKYYWQTLDFLTMFKYLQLFKGDKWLFSKSGHESKKYYLCFFHQIVGGNFPPKDIFKAPAKPTSMKMGDDKKCHKSAKIWQNFQTLISRVIWKLFEVCKSLKYSSGNWLSDYDPQEPRQDTPVLHNSN